CVIRSLFDDGDDQAAQRAWRQVVAMSFKVQCEIEEVRFFQPIASQGFVDRKAGDDRTTAAAQAARQRNLAVYADARAGKLLAARFGGKQRGAYHQIRFVKRNFFRAFARGNDLKAVVSRLDFQTQVQ